MGLFTRRTASIRTPLWTFLVITAAQKARQASKDKSVNAASAQAAAGAIADTPNMEEVDAGTPFIPIEKLEVMHTEFILKH